MKHANNLSFKKIASIGRNFLQTDTGKATIIAILWQLMMLAFGNIFEVSLRGVFHNSNPHTLLSHMATWDGNWYLSIVKGAYATNWASNVFYPLFPFSVWLLHFISFGAIGYVAAGLLINTIAIAFILVALLKIADLFLDKKYRWWLPMLFLTSPAALFLHFFYSEALFCAIGFWSYLFARQRQWWKMAVMLAILTAARFPAILFIGLCGLEFMRAYGWKVKKILNKNALWFLVTPAGILIYGLYLKIVRGDFFGMFNGYKYTNDWAYIIFNPNIFDTYLVSIKRVVNSFRGIIPFDPNLIINNALPLIGFGILFLASIYCLVSLRKKGGVPLGIFGLVSLVFLSLNSNLVSAHRYILPCVLIYIAAAHFASKKSWLNYLFYGSVYTGILLQAYLFILFVGGYFAG